MTRKRNKLEQLAEVDGLHRILSRLLPKMPNVKEVEYTHGGGEKGADFVLLVEHGALNRTQYVGVVVKVGKVTAKSAYDIERQIKECRMTRYFRGGKDAIRISEVWVITNQNITDGAKDRIHEEHRSQNVHFLDGQQISNLIEEYLPDYWRDVPLEIAHYLSTVRTSNRNRESQLSLLGLTDVDFYVEQDIYEHVEPKSLRSGFKSSIRKVNFNREISKEKILLVEGGMGAGKSRLIRRLVEIFTEVDSYLDTHLIPIVCTYKDFYDLYASDVRQLINAQAKEISNLDEEKTQIEYLLLIDGFDEKQLNSEQQIEALQKFIAAVEKGKNIRAVLTSRPLSGIEEMVDFKRKVARYKIQALTFHRTIEFLQTLCATLDIQSRIIEDLKKSALFRNIPQSPIAAIILAKLLTANRGEVPATLPELYAEYTELALGRWDIDKGFQSIGEYHALEAILMNIAAEMIENEMPELPIKDAYQFFVDYIKERNIEVEPHILFEKAIQRCELIMKNEINNTLSFKHRTFSEYLYAKWLDKTNSFELDNRAFQLYWMNIFYFFFGIKRDAPELLEQLSLLEPESTPERWLKMINLPNYYLAAFVSKYEVICKGVERAVIEAGELYIDTVLDDTTSPFSKFSKMQLLFIIQAIIRESYSFRFFKKALEEAALAIECGDYDSNVKDYAQLFLVISYIEMEGNLGTLDYLSERNPSTLPIELSISFRGELEHAKIRHAFVKKQYKMLNRMRKGTQTYAQLINNLYDTPVSELPSRNQDDC